MGAHLQHIRRHYNYTERKQKTLNGFGLPWILQGQMAANALRHAQILCMLRDLNVSGRKDGGSAGFPRRCGGVWLDAH